MHRWGGRPKSRPYLLDLARYELAVADARTQPWVKMSPQPAETDRPAMIRRSTSVSLIRCKYDIRPLLERDDATGTPENGDLPEKRDLFLAIVFPRGAPNERVFEIGADLAGFLASSTDWQPIDEKIDGLDRLFELELVEGR